MVLKSFKRSPPKMKKIVGLSLSLPTSPKHACTDFFEYVSLIYGRAGIGKTTWAAGFPNSLLLSCERVSKGVEAYDFNWENGGVTSWEIFLAAVDLIEKNPGKFKTVVIDTAEALYQHCFNFICKKLGVDHPSDGRDFGKAWAMIKDEFTNALDRIWKVGLGVCFTAHAKEVDVVSNSGSKYTRIMPEMAAPMYKYLRAKSDFMFYAEYLRDKDGNPLRVLITSGDDLIEAKSAGSLPRILPFTKEDGVQTVVDAFAGERVGINPSELRASNQTSKSGSALITSLRSKNAKKSGKIKKLGSK
jgi:hypothetical protein